MSSNSQSRLFTPLKIGNIEVKNRIVLAPMTRFRATDAYVPHSFVPEYYAQRACVPGTLLIAEATFVSPKAGGYGNVPGIYNKAQIDAWKKVTAGVHEEGSFIFLQLAAWGRAADPLILKKELGDDAKVISAGDIGFTGGAKPSPLSEEEIQEFIAAFAQAAKNAVEAGFDGVEIHAANGGLIDQFTQDVSNNRTDAWGGSVEKRSRFGLEVTRAIVEAIGAERTAIRLNATEKIDFLLDIWGNERPALVAGGYNAASAKKAVDEDHADRNVAIVFGRHFLSNPDLVFRIKEGIEFTPYDRSLFYNKEEENGYNTWPFSKEFEAHAVKA